MEEIKRELREIKGELKEINNNTRNINELISDMQGNINILLDINKDQKQTNKDIKLLLDILVSNHKEIKRDLDKIKNICNESRKLQYQEVI